MFKHSQETDSCSHCIDECYKVDYEYTTHTKPLKNVCLGNPDLQENVSLMSNDHLSYNFLPYEHDVQEMGSNLQITDSCFFYIKKNAAVVDIFVGSASVVQITRSTRVTFIQQLANTGKFILYIND